MNHFNVSSPSQADEVCSVQPKINLLMVSNGDLLLKTSGVTTSNILSTEIKNWLCINVNIFFEKFW